MSYPEIEDEDFYDKLNNKMEFYDNRIDNVKKGLFLEPNQNYVGNYISSETIYNNLLLYHSTGVGKSISAINIISQNPDKQVLVLIKNKSIEVNFKTQIERFEKEMNSAITDIKYINYGAFANRTIGIKGSEVRGGIITETRSVSGNRIENLSNHLIIVDEVHNIINNEGYKALRFILDRSKNYKLVLLSATPIFDNIKEIFELSNLLNDRYSQLPIRDELVKSGLIKSVDRDETSILSSGIFRLTTTGRKVLKETLKGRISYLTTDPSTFPRVDEKGGKIRKSDGESTLKVINCFMSDFQYKGYQKAIELDTNIITSEEIKRSSLFKNASDASTIIYPNGQFGKHGFYSTKDFSYLKKENVRKYSQKLYNILENVEKSNGPVLIYSEYVTAGGTELLELFFKINGYSQKMAVLHASVLPKNREKIRQKFNSIANSDGRLIKVLIGSQVISEGINFKRIRQIHILEPAWNLSRIQQIIGRGVRNRSHETLPLNDRKVEIYKYVSISNTENKSFIFIDETKYLLSEDKDKSIKEVERLLKTIAVDCSLHRPRNIEKGIDGSRDCDYDECSYTCEGNRITLSGSDKTTNTSSKNKREINFVSEKLIEIIERKEIISLNDILDLKIFEKISEKNIYDGIQLSIDRDVVLNGRKISGTIGYSSGPNGDSYYYIQDIDHPTRSLFDFSGKHLTRNTRSLEEYYEQTGVKSSPIQLVREVKELTSSQTSQNQNIKRNKIYGTKTNKQNVNDGKFRIVDTRKQSDSGDNRKEITGKVCSTYTSDELKEISIYFNPSIENEIRAKGSGYTKQVLCTKLEEYMVENNLIVN
jgi:superfamily II DNA or RNA helicase